MRAGKRPMRRISTQTYKEISPCHLRVSENVLFSKSVAAFATSESKYFLLQVAKTALSIETEFGIHCR
jgi:hypothetical protein